MIERVVSGLVVRVWLGMGMCDLRRGSATVLFLFLFTFFYNWMAIVQSLTVQIKRITYIKAHVVMFFFIDHFV